MSCVLHILYTQGIVICSLIFLEDVLKEEGDCDEEEELGLVAFELLNLFVVHELSIAFISTCYNILCFIICKINAV